MNYADYGFIRLAAIAPQVAIGNPKRNAELILQLMQQNEYAEVSLMLFPELCVSGYTCEDLFFNQSMINQCEEALYQIARATDERIVVVGAPWRLADGRLLNAGFVCQNGLILGAVPKTSHPNYGEFYDKRWFASGNGIEQCVDHKKLGQFVISTDQLFAIGESWFAAEICEDLWHPAPPSMTHVRAGAELIVNLSASNELVSKASYRRDLIRMASAQGVCAYLYSSSGPTESTKDIVFGGHQLFAENGVLLTESERFELEGSSIVCEFDWQKLRHDRTRNGTFANSERPPAYRHNGKPQRPMLETLRRTFAANPFVPVSFDSGDANEFGERASEILKIQSTGLARRMMASYSSTLVLGVSGGLDSTLAFLVCLDALEILNRERSDLCAITLPGPATSDHTLDSARMLAASAGANLKEVRIDAAVAQHLKDLSHSGEHDVVFENAQARERTQILFDLANKMNGIVVGTGDLSELALGWCTYNADQMSSYNVNASVPKTLVIYLVRWYALHRADKELSEALLRILDTPISPELVPSKADSNDDVAQHTESIIGPYELHDFFIYHYLRNGFDAEKIYHLAQLAFADKYEAATIKQWLKLFFKRFYMHQFKRTTLPSGPKVGSVSLSPRGDWRMPDEADVSAILEHIETLR